jgi:IS30 family transposase
MGRTYKQFSMEERCLLQTQLSMGWRPAAIAAGLQRARSTVTREMRRNGWHPVRPRPKGGRRFIAGGYHAATADRRARMLQRTPRVVRKLVPGTVVWDLVLAELGRGLSPEQVGFTLRRMPDPVRLSHETIYTALYAMPRGELRARVMTLLRRRRMSRRSRSKAAVDPSRRHFIDPIKLIDQRPEEVGLRLVPGHWEGDLIKGKLNQSRVGVLVERTTLFLALVKLEDGSAKTCAEGFARILNRFDSQMRRSMTYDQGREMAQHKWLEQQTGIEVYFAHPHSPWERGINENTNGLLRQFLPKGQDLSRFSQQQLDDIAMLINARIRKSLGKQAPAELFLPEGTFNFVEFWQNPGMFTNVALGT